MNGENADLVLQRIQGANLLAQKDYQGAKKAFEKLEAMGYPEEAAIGFYQLYQSMVEEALGIPSFVHTIGDGLEVWNRQPKYLRVYLAGQVVRSGATLSQYLEDGTLDEEHYVECITAYETLCSTYESLADLSNLAGDGSGALPDDFDMGSSYDRFIKQQALRKFYSQLLEEAAS